MIGEEEHRQPVGWHLHRAQNHSLTGEFGAVRTFQGRAVGAQSDAVALGRDPVSGLRQGPQRRIREPVGPGAQDQREHQLGRGSGQRDRVHRAGRRFTRDPERQQLPGLQRCGAEAGEQVGGPAAQHRPDRDATAERHIAAQPFDRPAHIEHGPRRHPYRRTPGGGAAVDPYRTGRTGHGRRDVRTDPYRGAVESGLQGGGVRRVPGEEVRQPVRGRVQGARARNAEMSVARAPEILHSGERPGAHHLQRLRNPRLRHPGPRASRAGRPHTASSVVNRTRAPGTSSAAGSRSWSHSTAPVVPISCQPPGDERG